MCGSAVFCVSRTYCSSAPAARDRQRQVVGAEAAQVERAELVGQQARGAGELEVPGRAHALLAVRHLADFARLVFGHQQLGGLEPLEFGFERRVAVGFEHRETAGGQIQPGEAEDARRPCPARRDTAANKVSRRCSSSASSVTVPGVTTRTTWRSTGPLDFAGSPICSQIATDSPLRTSRAR